MNVLLTLPQPELFKTTVIPCLVKHNLIKSEAILSNLHSVFYVAIFYHIWFLFGKWILFPPLVRWKLNYDQVHGEKKDEKVSPERQAQHYKKKSTSLINQSSVHLISLLQSIVVLYYSLKFLLDPKASAEPYQTSHSRVFAETRDTQVICIFAIGYFVWDIYISTMYSTFPFVVHGIISTVVFCIGLKPYIQYYAPVFLMFELSNPSLNFRWFGIKFLPHKSKFCSLMLLLNNMALMVIFFVARIAWGWYQIGKLSYDFYQVRNEPGFAVFDTIVILAGNFVLDVLNVIWFSTMVSVAAKVFKKGKAEDKVTKTEK
ncbi:hypothetical protein GRS66_011242 [Saccharomyces pastorianus]|uniref:TLC domain-containing protein n=1 Tax=Saccharomyces pastorianus TaxID=27292 RepID=A0A6C1EIF0_SACPS|nr:hypothetical protein GRS66_011242 [Saccharomyces pastorianus]